MTVPSEPTNDVMSGLTGIACDDVLHASMLDLREFVKRMQDIRSQNSFQNISNEYKFPKHTQAFGRLPRTGYHVHPYMTCTLVRMHANHATGFLENVERLTMFIRVHKRLYPLIS